MKRSALAGLLIRAASQEAPGDVARLVEITADEVQHSEHYARMLEAAK